ncbi:MAG: HesA/MoeB/ThiF family protein [Planctomycetota bacterium]|jgi:adenylyltransferase/sulfurtransferase|nr:HesA/MoeB/ThiF family protein [Planctomycetota bacterium]
MTDNERFARQTRLPQVGSDGQKLLSQATVAIVGVGALGCVSADWLCRAGIGKLILVDRDVVTLSNLQRQVLFTDHHAASHTPKAAAAQDRLSQINPECEIVAHCADLGNHNINQVIAEADIVVDGCDNFYTRYLVNDFCVKNSIPFIYAGAVATYGMVALFKNGKSCLRCLFPEPPPAAQSPTCASAGVLGPTIGVVASTASSLAIKQLVAPNTDSCFITIETWPFETNNIDLPDNSSCPCCNEGKYPWLDGEISHPQASSNCDNTEVHFAGSGFIDLMQLGDKHKGQLDNLVYSNFCLSFCHADSEVMVFSDRSIKVFNCDSIEDATQIIEDTIGL